MSPKGQNPRLSVVVPHLNESGKLAACLAALAAQRRDLGPRDLGRDPAGVEVIVVDNGSPVPPIETCERFGALLVVEPEPGPGPARNTGAHRACGELIAFLDCDCVPAPGWAATLIDYFDSHGEVDFVAGSIGVAFADPARPTAAEAYEMLFSYRTKMFVERDRFAATGNMAVRKPVFEAVGPFAGIGSHEDRLWGQAACARGFVLAHVPEARVLTAGCSDFRSLRQRLDRHVAHDFGEHGSGLPADLLWLAKAAAVALSPLRDAFHVLRSPDISGLRARSLAVICLVTTRTYRSWRMIGLLIHDGSAGIFGGWNRAQRAAPPSVQHPF